MDMTAIRLLVAFLVLSVGFAIIERAFGLRRARPWWRGGRRTDLAYWFFTPLVSKGVTRAGVLVALAAVAVAYGVPLERESIAAFARSGKLLGGTPLWAQALAALVVGDLVGYWMHRLFHREPLWRFHAVHHSSTELDWLASVRLHPVNELVVNLTVTDNAVPDGFWGR
jgi:sterol desaturase/sphingolipid hydroxylase (fatty acid hydroxylase superfamily)